jgi:hypothetical protein
VNETALLQEMTADLQSAPARTVIYLEGKTDTPMFFGLLGVPAPRDGLHQGVLVRGLKDNSGTGGSSVRSRVELAVAKGYPRIYGVIDGDGQPFTQLSASFDAPFAGPLFTWKGYCLESLIVKTGWPAAWGTPPDWTQVLLDFAPYVVLNRIHRDLLGKLETLHLWRFNRPILHEPLRTARDVIVALEKDKDLLKGYDVAARFEDELSGFEATVRASLDEGYALVDGKWLVNVFAPNRLGPSSRPQACRDAWIAHATSVGGLPQVRALWERITGTPP